MKGFPESHWGTGVVVLGRMGGGVVLGARGGFTLARWLLTLAHWAGTVLQHITISIWHCLLCLMSTHTNTHACVQTTREHTSQPQAPWDPSTGYWQRRRLVRVQDRAERENCESKNGHGISALRKMSAHDSDATHIEYTGKRKN